MAETEKKVEDILKENMLEDNQLEEVSGGRIGKFSTDPSVDPVIKNEKENRKTIRSEIF